VNGGQSAEGVPSVTAQRRSVMVFNPDPYRTPGNMALLEEGLEAGIDVVTTADWVTW